MLVAEAGGRVGVSQDLSKQRRGEGAGPRATKGVAEVPGSSEVSGVRLLTGWVPC